MKMEPDCSGVSTSPGLPAATTAGAHAPGITEGTAWLTPDPSTAWVQYFVRAGLGN